MKGEWKHIEMKFNIKNLDEIIMRPKPQLIVIGSRPALGKTSLALQIINKVASPNIPVAIFKMDTPKEELLPYLDNVKNIYIDDCRNITMKYLETQCRKLVQENNVKVVLVDYLQQMSQYLTMTRIGNRLKALAEELQIMIIALSNLTRDIESREDKNPRLTDFKHNSLTDLADIVIILYKDIDGNIDTVVAKNE